jgi:multiple antibiotic resistance protein
MLHKLFNDFVTLFVLVNPIGNIPLFIAIAGHENSERQRQIAMQGVVAAALILLFFIAIGQLLLDALGVTLPSFQVAGGLVLLIIGLRMVFEEVRVASIDTKDLRNVAIFPLAAPFLAGPGAVMGVILLTDNNVYTIWQQVQTSLIMLAVMLITYVCLVGTQLIHRLLGTTGTNVVSRIMGLILAALAVQEIINGLHQFTFS